MGIALLRSCAFGLAALYLTTAHAAAPSIEDFASRARIEDAAISPDGHYIAVIKTQDGRGAAVVIDRSPAHAAPVVVLSEPPHFRLTWCRWATDTRLLCGYLGMAKPNGYVYSATRLVAVGADGKNTKVLIQNSETAQGQYQDQVINWNPGVPDSVLIEADEGLSDEQATGIHQVFGEIGSHAAAASPTASQLAALTRLSGIMAQTHQAMESSS